MEYNYRGLNDVQVEKSRRENGSNAITPREAETFWDKLQENFKDPMIVILMAALLIVTILALMGFAKWYEGFGIAAAVVLATFVSTVSEYKNEQTFQKLQEEASKIKANVFRSGGIRNIPIEDVVVGDIVLLQPGDKICADGRILEGDIHVNQAMFTGEVLPVPKEPGRIDAEDRDFHDPHLVFRGTVVEDGEAVMDVDFVGEQTLYGQLIEELEAEDRKGPLRVKLGKLAESISKFGYIGATFIALAFIFKTVLLDNDFDLQRITAYLTHWQLALYDISTAAILAVIIIVVAVPEGLPMMIAIVLAQNMKKLLNSNVLVRQLLGIETSGSINILLCDKTGTITKGLLEPVCYMMVSDQTDENGKVFKEYSSFDIMPERLKKNLDLSLRENTSTVINLNADIPSDRLVGGNVTERALLKFVHAHERQPSYIKSDYQLVETVLFNTKRKFSASRIRSQKNGELTLVKGAPEKILDKCMTYYSESGDIKTLSNSVRNQLNIEMNDKSEKGFRIIAAATSKNTWENEEDIPDSLSLIGLISLRDELRPEAKKAVESLHKASVQVLMITGDKIGTAKAIAKEVGLLNSTEDVVLESSELENISDEELHALLPKLKVIARCLPTDKKRLVKVAQDLGMVVGMTGDGVNDSPALSNSDVGFGMGSGSEVAKEASEIVIMDDNIHSIVNAIHYGRTIYRSIQKFITFQLTVNVSAISIAFLGPFLGYRLPLTMIQLLWVNLIMDTLAALAFSGEPPLEKHMREKPKKREESIITPDMWSSILLNGFFITVFSVLFLKWPVIRYLFHSEAAYLTAFFGFFVFLNNFNKFNVRVEEMGLLDHILENKGFLRIVGLIFIIQILVTYFGGEVFRTVDLTLVEWVIIFSLSALIIPFDLMRKAIVILMR